MEKIFIKTFGCSLNQSDSEVMAGILKKSGFKIVRKIEDSEIVIINTCTVKGPTENNFFKYLESVGKDKKVIVSGCIAQTDPEKLAGYSMVGVSQISRIVEVVEEVINGNVIVMVTREKNPRLNLPKIRRNRIIEIIPICAGCLGEPCAYCKVKSARGDLISYKKEDIIKQAKDAVADGVKEIWLTAQDTGCYGKDIGSSLPEMINEIAALPGDFFIRIGMMNPNHALEFLDELILSYKNDKVFKFLHIPVQSGNDEILKKMRRKYSAADFKKIVKRFKEEIPEFTLSTDIICGFPGETEKQFYDSVELVKTTMPAVLNISRFWPRPGTEAADMEDQLTGGETKRRSTILSSIFNSIARMENERWLEWEGSAIIDEPGKEETGTFITRNYAYKPIVLKGDFKIGQEVKIKIEKVTKHDLRGAII